MPRILSIDYGQKRTGIAVTDELQIIASGLTTIPSATAIDFLKDYFSKEKVEAVLIGEPKQMNGQPSESASIIKGFVTIDFSKYKKFNFSLLIYKAKIVIHKTFIKGIAKVKIIADKINPSFPKIAPARAKKT